MASMTSVPCPMCGRMNGVEKLTCTTCGYEFVNQEDAQQQASLIKRTLGRLAGRN